MVDAGQRELEARIEVMSEQRLALVVADAAAVYPVRIDPTFSDENWVSFGGLPGADERVYAAVVDGAGNLYVGGQFTTIGTVVANRIAKWDGSAWSALGSGMNERCHALAVSGTTSTRGAIPRHGGVEGVANHIAKWNGSAWSALGSGMNNAVPALAVSGTRPLRGGHFTTAGGVSANHIAKWNGSAWSALGSGMNNYCPCAGGVRDRPLRGG